MSEKHLHDPTPKTSTVPVQPVDRIDFVDILRGFAVFGILVANMASYSGHTTDLESRIDIIDHSVLVLVRFLVTAKFYSLFSFLFGWGMSVQMTRAANKGINFTSLYLRRLIILMLIGVAHGILVWTGDILTLYAILGLLLLTLRNRSEKFLIAALIFSLFFAILIRAPGEMMTTFRGWYEHLTSFMRSNTYPESLYATGTYLEITRLRLQEYVNGLSWTLYYFGNVFGMFLLGLIVGKRKIFQAPVRYLPLFRKVLWFGLIVGVISHGVYVWMSIHPNWSLASWIPLDYNQVIQRTFYTIGAPALMLFYASGIILLLQKKKWRQQLAPLGNVGRMALSNYLLQSIVLTLIFYNYGLGLYGQISPTVGLILTIILFLIQIRISEWWFNRNRFGPMEWVWRTLTYGKLHHGQPGEIHANSEPASWLQNIKQSTSRINPIAGLLGAWLFLLIWAILLSVWYTRSEANIPNTVSQKTDIKTPTPSLVKLSTEEVQDETAITVVTPPKVRPIINPPSSIAASGDILAIADSFDIGRAIGQIETLTSPPYLGRQAGSPEGQAAGNYIAEQFSTFGLQPIGDNHTFFQTFTVTYTPFEGIPALELEDNNGVIHNNYKLYQDYSPIVRWYSGSGETYADMYWVNECTPEDFAEVNVVSKVVLCDPDLRTNWMMDSTRNALEHGASGLLFVGDPLVRPPDFASPFKDIWVPTTIPTFWAYPDLVEDLLEGSGKSLEGLHLSNEVFPLKSKIHLQLNIKDTGSCPGTECVARNILGVLPGRDPEFSDEVVILGAHYDHMGQGPDGTIWRGANDNASGVAVLLEIARSWQELGYVPRRTVIFAAWDAEEIGLLGSRHYVESPYYPLENTIAMIQLDMVGAGTEELSIDENSTLSEHIQRVAQTLEIPTNITHNGRSDHTPFLESGIPASLLVWSVDETYNHYHRPADTFEVIDPKKMGDVANIAQITILDIVESEPAITSLLSNREQAVETNDLTGFTSTSQTDQVENDIIWFNDLQTLSPTKVEIKAQELQVTGDSANASVRINIEYLGDGSGVITSTLSAIIPTEFSRDSRGWKWAGPHLLWSETTIPEDMPQIAIAYPPGKEDSVNGINQFVSEQYRAIADLLELPSDIDANLLLMQDMTALQASTKLSLPENQTLWVGPGTIKLVYSDEISTSHQLQAAIAKLVLSENGVDETAASWLWQGLPEVLNARLEPISIQERFLPELQGVLISGDTKDNPAAAWAATDYLQKQLGWSGLGNFIYRLGKICQESGCSDPTGLDATLLNTIQLDSLGFENAWQSHWRSQLDYAQAELDYVLSIRSEAVMSMDENRFLSTVNPAIPNLIHEERGWFNDLKEHPVQTFALEAQPLALLLDGSILARVNQKYFVKEDNNERSAHLKILFNPLDSGFLWSGPMFYTMSGSQVDIRYPMDEDELALEILTLAETIYPQLAASLGIDNPNKITFSLYKNPDNFRGSIFLSYPETDLTMTWSDPNGSIKIQLIPELDIKDFTPLLATQLSRKLLYQSGIDAEWLVSGVSYYLSSPYAKGTTQKMVGIHLVEISDAAKGGYLTPLTNIQPSYLIPKAEHDLVQAQTWDVVDYLVNTYGWNALIGILNNNLHREANLEDAVIASLGITLDTFEDNWINSLANGHSLASNIQFAKVFDQEKAMRHVDYLASQELSGRQAGSSGNSAAADYIARKFEEYGLLPAGDQILLESQTNAANNHNQGLANITETIEPEPVITETTTTYHQSFPISYTIQISVPELVLINQESNSVTTFQYRLDFLPIQLPFTTNRSIVGELVWIGDEGYQGVNLEGKIVLRKTTDNLSEEIVQAVEHGAGGLLIAGFKQDDNDLFAKKPLINYQNKTETIPVYELTVDGQSRLLEIIGQTRRSMDDLLGIHLLGIHARLNNHYKPPNTVDTTNILGILPGSDPFLSRETIVIGAHYDHVGDDPDGTRYSGENDNASGVGVLLEIARLWQEMGYNPKRSILFAAWGAQEMGELGSQYYIEHPTLPLERTKVMIQLDGVGGGDGFNLGAQGIWEQDGIALFQVGVAGNILEERVVLTQTPGKSDHLSFRKAGIPALLLSWRLASEDNLPDYLANNVNPDRLGITGHVATLVLMNLSR